MKFDTHFDTHCKINITKLLVVHILLLDGQCFKSVTMSLTTRFSLIFCPSSQGNREWIEKRGRGLVNREGWSVGAE